MRVWGKARAARNIPLGVARAAAEGKGRQDLLKEAVRSLLATGQVDRAGVWLESADDAFGDPRKMTSFHGIVAEVEADATPPEWSKLSPTPPLPSELLLRLQSVEQELNESHVSPMIGALVEMRHALWVPIVIHGHLRGVLLAGQRKKHGQAPRAIAESIAAELALALQLEDERRLVREHDQDVRRVIAVLTGSQSPDDILKRIVVDCVQKPEHDAERHTTFAAIGQIVDPPRASQNLHLETKPTLRFAWHSGTGAWIRMLESGELSQVWRRALTSHRVAGREAYAGPLQGQIARIVAWPLEADGEMLGALVVGIPRNTASLAALQRLELSAAIASSTLLALKRTARAAEQELQPKETLAATEQSYPCSPEPKSASGLPGILNVIEWLEEGVVLFDADQKVRAVNTRFGELIGLSAEELVAVTTADDVAAALSARTADATSSPERWRLTDPQHAIREELHLLRPVPRLLERAACPLLDDKGAFSGHLEIYHDLTAQRVFQSKLLQTEKLAELGQMVTGVAHELSNPLTSILGYAQRLLLRNDAAGGSHEARQIFQEADRASAILRQLLLSARQSPPERRQVALNQVIARTLELQNFNGTARNIHVQLDLDPVLPFVQADAGQIQQVLMNLMANARHAIEEQGRGGTIQIKTARLTEKRVLLQVSDDGPGIPPAIQARIFDPFFTTKPAGVGTGLGLAIVLDIVREHGGKVHLNSNPGQGSVFSIELRATRAVGMQSPLKDGARPKHARYEPLVTTEALEAVDAGVTLGPWAGARILVLEDEPTVARLIADVLEDEGLRVDVLLDPREALDRISNRDYALIICDMKMPELDGEHFYQELVRTKNPLRDRFLFVTGDVLAAHTRNFLQRNRVPHVAKPFRVEELTERVRGVLEETLPREHAPVPATKRNAARK